MKPSLARAVVIWFGLHLLTFFVFRHLRRWLMEKRWGEAFVAENCSDFNYDTQNNELKKLYRESDELKLKIQEATNSLEETQLTEKKNNADRRAAELRRHITVCQERL